MLGRWCNSRRRWAWVLNGSRPWASLGGAIARELRDSAAHLGCGAAPGADNLYAVVPTDEAAARATGVERAGMTEGAPLVRGIAPYGPLHDR